ncbi:MAG TPA: hypothetical protein VFA70_10170 [Dehalococcoidia bacterium]|nr:hypothetical protein [Dehalococcoidia bacterium]
MSPAQNSPYLRAQRCAACGASGETTPLDRWETWRGGHGPVLLTVCADVDACEARRAVPAPVAAAHARALAAGQITGTLGELAGLTGAED